MLRRDLRSMKLFIETHMWMRTYINGGRSLWIAESRSSLYVGFEHFFKVIIFFIFADLVLVFFKETYNTWSYERYKDDPSTHPRLNPYLWLEARSWLVF